MRFRALLLHRSNSDHHTQPMFELENTSDAGFHWVYEQNTDRIPGPFQLLDLWRDPVSDSESALAANHDEAGSDRTEATSSASHAEPETALIRSTDSSLNPEQASALSGPQQRLLAARLDLAVDDWREANHLPSIRLTEEGLFALDSGTALEPSQTSLLLASALHHRRGILTALRHQDDPVRTGLIIADALTTPTEPLPLDLVADLPDGENAGGNWRPHMLGELAISATGAEGRPCELAKVALRQLQVDAREPSEKPGRRNRLSWRPAMLAVTSVVAVALVAWLGSGMQAASAEVILPAGQYLVTEAGGGHLVVESGGFSIDRYEVTNQRYAACVRAGACTTPASNDASYADEQFGDPAFDQHPVVNVSWVQAHEYCEYRGMRLPTAEEWTLAASAAPLTDRPTGFPWGVQFDVQRANTRESGYAGPVEVGSFSPAGDSAIGAGDMSGNVAEWTNSPSSAGPGYVVKGGSFAHAKESAVAYAEKTVAADAVHEWIGFRCVERQ